MGLLSFLKNLPTQNEMKGSLGEWLAKTYAKSLPDTLILHDVLIDGAEQGTSQIDLLVIGHKGIYVIEVKLFADAKIYGDTQKRQWHYYKHGQKYTLYNPLMQNQKHVEYLKRFLKDMGDIPCCSVVIMICENFKVSGENPPDTALCNSIRAMGRAMNALGQDKQVIWNEEKQKEIYDYIQSNQYSGAMARLEHKQRVAAYKAEQERTQQQKICPYCNGALVLRNGKYGGFYGCSNYPKCTYTLNDKIDHMPIKKLPQIFDRLSKQRRISGAVCSN